MIKLDLHTHSNASPDGGLSLSQYKKVLNDGLLDIVAVTDHNSIDNALGIKKILGDSIIVGEEIMTTEGEIIGLYLTQPIKPHMTPIDTIQSIKAQGGIVYIPHPFETVRKGLHPQVLEEILDKIDVLEICNGRAFVQDRSKQAVVWARINRIIGAASSDAHGYHGIGNTYTLIAELPTASNITQLLSKGTPIAKKAKLRSLLYPKYHTIRKKIKRNQ